MRKILRFAKIACLASVAASLLVGGAFAEVYVTRPQPVVAKSDDLGTLACGSSRCLISKNIERVTCEREQCTISLTGGLGMIRCNEDGCKASREVLAQFWNNHIPKECPDNVCTMSFD